MAPGTREELEELVETIQYLGEVRRRRAQVLFRVYREVRELYAVEAEERAAARRKRMEACRS